MLTLRIRMPIVQDLLYPRNFITKIIKYNKVRRAASAEPWRCVLKLGPPTVPALVGSTCLLERRS